ncbi:MAG: TIGR03087 family PEP-CTERM/XrtA system glycosyltransferase [Phycisphaerae bacterium]|nr:TIGR03087 family PEP-CTERM/XrtA system glycosyltransferase [Phycisphaerae bacterium]
MIAQRLPYPPDKGEKIRSFNELKHLAARHDLWCACLIDDRDDWQHVGALQKLCRGVAAFPLRPAIALARGAISLASGGTLTEGYFASRRLADHVTRWSQEIGFDAVLAFSSSIARYGLLASAARRVVDFCDVDSAKWRSYADKSLGPMRWIYAAEARRLARRERDLARAYDAAAVISEREAAVFRQSATGCRGQNYQCNVSVVGNGIDLEALHATGELPKEPVAGFVGTMNYPPNVDAVCWFVQEAWPLIRQARPDARFIIVGRSPSRRVLNLGKTSGVEITGSVPDVREYLKRMRLCVIPLRMVHGLQNKVLEAMACGKPVVTTPAVAETMGAEPGRHLLTAQSGRELASQVLDVFGNHSHAESLASAGREFVAAHYRWDDQMALLEGLLEKRGDRIPEVAEQKDETRP